MLRAYHQTVLALRVRPEDPRYRGGIARGALDGYFTAALAENGRVAIAADSDRVLAFSLYETTVDTSLRRGESPEEAVRECLRELISPGQRRFAEVALLIKRDFTDPGAWETASSSLLADALRFASDHGLPTRQPSRRHTRPPGTSPPSNEDGAGINRKHMA